MSFWFHCHQVSTATSAAGNLNSCIADPSALLRLLIFPLERCESRGTFNRMGPSHHPLSHSHLAAMSCRPPNGMNGWMSSNLEMRWTIVWLEKVTSLTFTRGSLVLCNKLNRRWMDGMWTWGVTGVELTENGHADDGELIHWIVILSGDRWMGQENKFAFSK